METNSGREREVVSVLPRIFASLGQSLIIAGFGSLLFTDTDREIYSCTDLVVYRICTAADGIHTKQPGPEYADHEFHTDTDVCRACTFYAHCICHL